MVDSVKGLRLRFGKSSTVRRRVRMEDKAGEEKDRSTPCQDGGSG